MFLNDSTPGSRKPSIISLVPSITELLFDLGLDDEVTGITKFCIHPASWHREKIKIGGTKTLDIKKIKSLNPTLIIANKEENVKSQVEELSDFPVWLTDVNTFEDACQMIIDLGQITGTQQKAAALETDIRRSFAEIGCLKNPVNGAYLIWKDPFMAAGSETFIHDMLTRTGMRNVFGDKKRYPEVSLEDIKNAGCEVLLLSTEPYPFKQKHVDDLARQLHGIRVKIVDGEMFSWYGSRLLQSAAYLRKLQADMCAL